jgi:stage II sporulation protein AA (anti-sigma F factor antagonist)
LDFQEIESERDKVLERLEHDPSLRGLLVDLGSTALGMLVRLWQRLRDRGGRMGLCNVSAHEREILEVTGLAGLWPVYPHPGSSRCSLFPGLAVADDPPFPRFMEE